MPRVCTGTPVHRLRAVRGPVTGAARPASWRRCTRSPPRASRQGRAVVDIAGHVLIVCMIMSLHPSVIRFKSSTR